MSGSFPIRRDPKDTPFLLFRAAGRGGRPSTFPQPHTLWKHLKLALEDCSLPPISWYGCTRHAFASHFVMGGGSIERLRVIMGHESVTTTERYAHLSPSNYGARELGAVVVDLSPATGKVIPLSRAVPGAVDHGVTTDAEMEVARTAATS